VVMNPYWVILSEENGSSNASLRAYFARFYVFQKT